ncbi:hypothetical protein FHS15_004101 [Paenibacillus castaneae]|uniref:DUF4153 domain-containing protein n=1 Tax=Paenibacillus castaneae TaxID=474957 RepID=UPI000C9ADEBE|nr:DUF4173 domain-containing protein [Paenibacillus castaneae]NIK78955.1 hypothetical protein [Paenibacillus castaneae]
MRDPAPWQKRYERMLVLALLFGVMSQYLFVGADAGISALLFVLGFYGLFFYSIQGRMGGFEKWQGRVSSGWLLFIPIFMLTLTYALYANSLFRVLNVFAIFALIVAQTALLTRSSVKPWYRGAFYTEMMFLSLIKPFAFIAVPFSVFNRRLKETKRGDATRSTLNKVLLGLVIAAPILIVVLSLLASADEIFFSWMIEIPHLLGRFSLGDGIFRAIVAAFFAMYTFCYIWGLLFHKSTDSFNASLAGQANVPPRNERIEFDPITAGTLLISINIVYVLFVVIQFSYLFGAANGLLPEGAAYAEYARRGFAELIMVSLINIGLLMCGLHLIRRSSKLAESIRKLSLTVLIGCTIVMLVSAYCRLSLYEEAYGFTQTRLLVHGFMLFLGVLLVIAMLRIWKEQFSMGKAYICVTIIAFVVMNYMNVDARIASYNSNRFERTGKIDVAYMGTLSTDAAPALLKLQARHPNLDGLNKVISRLEKEARADYKWQSWNLSKQRVR